KRAISTIVVESVRATCQTLRTAGHWNLVEAAVGFSTRARDPFRVKVHVVCDEKVQSSIPVVVEKAAASSPATLRPCDAGFARNIFESAIRTIAIKDVSTPVANKQIVESVVVIVAYTTALTPPGTGDSSLFGDIGENHVTIVPEQIACRFA